MSSIASSLPVFNDVRIQELPLANGVSAEAEWGEEAAIGPAVAHISEGPPGFAVPRSYARLSNFAGVALQFSERGLPVQIRSSGGGLVPRGPGILNLSLVWAPEFGSLSMVDTEAVYQSLTNVIALALRSLDIIAVPHL